METSMGALTAHEINQNCDHLRKMSNNYFVLYIKSLGFHWNVTGINFVELHSFFEEIYRELLEKIDDIAERLRTLDVIAPSNIDELSKLSVIENSSGTVKPSVMLDVLQDDHQIIIKELQLTLKAMDESLDEGTKDLLIEHLREFEKRSWMIRNLNCRS